MSIRCTETDRAIRYNKKLYAATRGNIEALIFLSEEAVEKIPKEIRRKKPCAKTDHGMDVYRTNSSMDSVGNHSQFNLKSEGFVFSISEESAKVYLPVASMVINFSQ